MPTQTQLDQLAKELYPGTTINTDYTSSDGDRNNDLAISMGFITSASSTLYVWSGEELSKNNAYLRYFGPTYTARRNYSRNDSTEQAVCLAD